MARQCTLLLIPHSALRHPLPLYTTDDRTEIMLQLLESRGSDMEHFATKLLSVSVAHRGDVLVASAASGVGKTHVAYAWGVQHGFNILSRAITSNYSAKIAPPFAWVLKQLEQLRFVPPDDAQAASAAATLFVRLALLSFVHFSVIALRALRASHPSATTDMRRQLLLRLHRNGNADDLITVILDAMMVRMRVRKWITCGVEIYALDERRLLAYELLLATAVRDVMGSAVLITVDEAHELMERRECQRVAPLFLSQSADGSAALAGVVSDTPASSSHKSSARGLFYAVVLELSRLQAAYGWSAYVTGTSLSMCRVAESSSASVATRCHSLEFAPTHRLTVPDMVSIVLSYWILDEVLDDATVRQRLGGFIGRPQLFVEGVFEPLLEWVRFNSRLPSAVDLVSVLDSSFQKCVRLHKDFFIAKIERNHPVAKDGEGTLALIRLLFKVALMDSGKIVLGNDDQLAAAICTGLLAVSSNLAPGSVNMRDEPIMLEGIRAAVLDPTQGWRVLDVLMGTSQQIEVYDKGGALEIAISWHVALTCNKIKDPSLATVLESLGVARSSVSSEMDTWVVRATGVLNDEQGKEHNDESEPTPLLRYFVKPDGSIDDSHIVFNIPSAMGIDIALLASRVAPAFTGADGGDIFSGRQYKLVVLQCKNAADTTVATALLTLHPGTQFLTNFAQERLLKLKMQRVVSATQSGWEKWHDLDLDRRFSLLTRNWVRIAVVAHALDAEIAAFSLAAATADASDHCVRSWNAAQRELACHSPVVWVSLATTFGDFPGAFPDEVRAFFVRKAGSSAAVALTESHVVLRHRDLWVPVSVVDAAQLVEGLPGSKRQREGDGNSRRYAAAPPSTKKR